ncbi:3-phosphoserine/phosphohydroxythreonine transaminase [Pseudomarimonas salicorniae]|uniref:Phosphoserine aminotransferase n=1 Tax=Pseudomarimonas salicorniae TaxID=2933270 RepID=A0ABT0GK27_9GAMM|nr:3-phosphoserine/phosphohydroxythreonine transaminase [Lysobacter sp. CAU 1642]MCK7594893.1 3-phosphoserine/phosphohydroxythreonine transaminase [Lysobacter sp. CAU 1642]
MSRAYNFSAGPAALPEPVLEQARDELLEWKGERASVMEVSHRGKAFVAMAEESEADLRTLLAVPDDYAVLFLQGGATQQFAQIPLNIATPGQAADYLVTGAWGQKAVSEAKPYVNARIAASTEEGRFTDVPDADSWSVDPAAAYLHYTPNETIHGVEFHALPDSGDVPLVGDFSSTILSRPVDVSKFGIIYAGAQKNIGPSGLVLMVIRRELMERSGQARAKILNFAAQAKEGSMLNTPPTLSWYLAGLVFKWLREQGGLEAMAKRNQAKADLLYAAIDNSGGFYRNPVAPRARSWMNVPFTLKDAALDSAFLKESEAAGLLALKGHRAVGGMRASIYNAMPIEGVKALVDFMADFARRNG